MFSLLEGKSCKQIADSVFLSEGTVRNYIHNIYEILGIHTRGELFVWAAANMERWRTDSAGISKLFLD